MEVDTNLIIRFFVLETLLQASVAPTILVGFIVFVVLSFVGSVLVAFAPVVPARYCNVEANLYWCRNSNDGSWVTWSCVPTNPLLMLSINDTFLPYCGNLPN